MYQGTTPTIHLSVDGYDLSEMHIEVAIQVSPYSNDVIIRTGDQLVVDGSNIYIRLSQEETFQLQPGYHKVQARFVDRAGNAYATDEIKIKIEKPLTDNIIEYQEQANAGQGDEDDGQNDGG